MVFTCTVFGSELKEDDVTIERKRHVFAVELEVYIFPRTIISGYIHVYV